MLMVTLKQPREPQTRAFDPANNRRNGRETLIVPAKLWPGDDPEGDQPRPVWIFNISDGGIAFRATKALEPTSYHFLRAEAGPVHLATRVRIVWCRRRDNGSYEAGAEFLRD